MARGRKGMAIKRNTWTCVRLPLVRAAPPFGSICSNNVWCRCPEKGNANPRTESKGLLPTALPPGPRFHPPPPPVPSPSGIAARHLSPTKTDRLPRGSRKAEPARRERLGLRRKRSSDLIPTLRPYLLSWSPVRHRASRKPAPPIHPLPTRRSSRPRSFPPRLRQSHAAQRRAKTRRRRIRYLPVARSWQPQRMMTAKRHRQNSRPARCCRATLRQIPT